MVGVCGFGAVGDGPFVGDWVVDGVVANGGDVFDCRPESRVRGEEQVRAFFLLERVWYVEEEQC